MAAILGICHGKCKLLQLCIVFRLRTPMQDLQFV